MQAARKAFIITAVPITFLAVLLLVMEKAFAGSPGSSTVPAFCLSGGTYIYGSIFALRGGLPLSLLVLLGIVLNIIGAIAWIPMAGHPSRDGIWVGAVGTWFTALWCMAVYSAYREESHYKAKKIGLTAELFI